MARLVWANVHISRRARNRRPGGSRPGGYAASSQCLSRPGRPPGRFSNGSGEDTELVVSDSIVAYANPGIEWRLLVASRQAKQPVLTTRCKDARSSGDFRLLRLGRGPATHVRGGWVGGGGEVGPVGTGPRVSFPDPSWVLSHATGQKPVALTSRQPAALSVLGPTVTPGGS